MQMPNNRATDFLTRPVVLVAVGAIIVILIVWDIFLAVDGIGGNTWSELLRNAGLATPVVPWLGGVVMGHWFHPFEHAEPLITPPGNALALVALTLLVVLVGFATNVPTWVPVPLGGAAGAVLWPVSVEHQQLRQIVGRGR